MIQCLMYKTKVMNNIRTDNPSRKHQFIFVLSKTQNNKIHIQKESLSSNWF